MKKAIQVIVFLGVIYPFGILLGIIFQVLKWLKVINVLHWERFPRYEEKMILVVNHPSMMDPFLISALFFREYLFHPFKRGPLNVPDKKIFSDSWYWFWLRQVLIPVERGNVRAELRAFFEIKKVIICGRVIILFPDGGRSFKGKNFLFSEKGNKIRILKDGIGWLIIKTGASVLPVWIEGSDEFLPNSRKKLFTGFRFNKKITIRIGEPLTFQRFHDQSGSRREQVTQTIVAALLKLSDEEE